MAPASDLPPTTPKAQTQASQTWDPDRYARNAGFVAEHGLPVLELLAPRPQERILDLGCGDGVLSEKLTDLKAEVVAVDASIEQVAAARARGLDARYAQGEALNFFGEFDAVFSNAALHWMLNPEAVIDGVQRALKPGGRFVAEMGGVGNVARIVTALVAASERRGLDGRGTVPWYFPAPEEYQDLLEQRGLAVQSIELIPRPTPLPGEMIDWLETFAESFLRLLPENEVPDYLAEVSEALRPDLCDALGRWTADYVRLRFAAIKAV